MTLDRRQFLGWTAAGAAVLGFGPMARAGGPSGSRPSGLPERILVVLQLSGGNDGLSTVVPFEDDAYGRARRRTRIAPAEVLRISDGLGLNPNLKGLEALYREGKVAIIPGAGYPNPTRSHFESLDIWHAADPKGRRAGYGWVGRLASAAWPDEDDPNLVIHVGDRVPFSLQSPSHPPVAFSTPLAYKWVGVSEEQVALERAAPLCDHEKPGHEAEPVGPNLGRDRALARLRRTLHEAQASSEAVRTAAARYRPAVAYPADPFAASLATVSALIAGNLGTRVYSVETGGFDTHTNQRGTHDGLMKRLGDGIVAFQRNLEALGVADRVVVVAFSEFGRRLAENASGGTDHGVAGPMFVIGTKVSGGIAGKHPSLAELDRGDLVPTTDFRSVYATLIDGWLRGSHRAVLGRAWPTLPLFPS